MKKILFIAFIAFFINAKAQIALEHTYDSASTCTYGSPALMDQLMIINFEISGEKYIKINRHSNKICVYNMTHALMKTIDYSGFPQASTAGNYIIFMYFSETLFDKDSEMEFMYFANTGIGNYYTGIYNEDGSLIFSDNGAVLTFASWPPQQYPIYNTTQGTKLILSYANGQANVFSLPGTLSNNIEDANNDLITTQMQSTVSNSYPNPTNNTTQIDYSLPESVNEGEIVFYDLLGNEIKRFKVDRTFASLLISTSDITAGTYYYQLQTTVENSEGKKMVVIK